jgi:transcriptional regulator with XRE-family HTH domain
MKLRGLNANQLAKRAGIPNQMVYRYLKAQAGVTVQMAEKLASALDVHADDLRPDAPLRSETKIRAVRAIDGMDDDLVRRLLPMLEAGTQVEQK